MIPRITIRVRTNLTSDDLPAEGKSGLRHQDIIEKIRRKLLTGGGASFPMMERTPYWADVIQTGGISDLIRRYGRGGTSGHAGHPPVYVDEWGEVHVETSRLWRLQMGGGGTFDSWISTIFSVDPNMAGGIDPPPPFLTMGGKDLILPERKI